MGKGKAAAALVAVGSLAGAVLWRRRGERTREHVDLYYADGSMVSFPGDSDEAVRLLPVARRALSRARTAAAPPA
jgi:hypothetical protein